MKRNIAKKQPKKFTTKDSGKRVDFKSGMRRDSNDGKDDYSLCWEPMLTRWAGLMTRGAEKYGRRNWMNANSPEELDRFLASGFRHFVQFFRGDTDEDHAAAVFFNVAAAEYVRGRLAQPVARRRRGRR
jgi:hypothetical protein